MLFNSWTFAVFFLVVYSLYVSFGHRAQNILLLVASFVFYGWWDWRFLGLLWGTTLLDWAIALRIDSSKGAARRRWLEVSIVANLLVLGFFKYANFFVESAEALLRQWGMNPEPWHLGIALPVGISFYTFQSMSYVVDVYRGEMAAVKNPLEFALFVAFFPQLVAGPIERAGTLIRQIRTPRIIVPAEFRDGVFLCLGGLFKKIVIADNCAQIVHRIFEASPPAVGWAWVLGGYAFAVQIYCDFSGYADIARGLAKMMGFELMLNFRLPHFAKSPSDLWHRWHISLSTWLRDYLYIPLGGNRRGEMRNSFNLFVTMLLAGLWHGANWTMVLFGAYHGTLLVVERFLKRMAPWLRVPAPVAVIGMFHLMCLGYLIFRAQSFTQITAMVASLGAPPHGGVRGSDLAGMSSWLQLCLLGGPLLAIQLFQARRNDLLAHVRLPREARLGLLLGCAFVAYLHWVLYGQGLQGGEEFYYFQF